ncbi:Methyltransferase domain protein [Leptospira interrogans]|nr:Methyltransferase domain protein [Leptospira interrogans]
MKFGKLNKKQESSDDLTLGANGLPFEIAYWRDIYGSGTDVDATFNAKEHARYAKSILNLMEINVNSIADFGFGKAILLKEMVKILNHEESWRLIRPNRCLMSYSLKNGSELGIFLF